VVRADLSRLAAEPVIVIGGPTATGKTDAAIEVCRRFGGEVINGDSVQIYKGFDIGSAKPDEAERAGIPHHLLDVLDPSEEMSAGVFTRAALRLITALHARDNLPVVVGGTGLYLRALMLGLNEMPFISEAIRVALRRRLQEDGLAALRADLEQADPAYAARISPQDTQRTMRALEVFHATGQPFTDFHRPQANEGDEQRATLRFLPLVLFRERAALYERINRRVQVMIDRGFVDEVRGLYERHGGDIKSMRSLGYRQIIAHLEGHTTLDEAIAKMAQGHRNYAKRQLTWFRRASEGYQFVEADDRAGLMEKVERFV
jgi:tRNA dimethylallyltransferase